uniref:Uncharacterized protein n=1 Tax=Tetranychus urticae TaxID=32264 RepID=T1KCE6_TETUR
MNLMKMPKIQTQKSKEPQNLQKKDQNSVDKEALPYRLRYPPLKSF